MRYWGACAVAALHRSFDSVLVLNSRRIRLYSPLHALLDALPPALAFDVLPLRLALESRPCTSPPPSRNGSLVQRR